MVLDYYYYFKFFFPILLGGLTIIHKRNEPHFFFGDIDIDNLCGPKKSQKNQPTRRLNYKKEITGQHWYPTRHHPAP
jgi:hypothetical protein